MSPFEPDRCFGYLHAFAQPIPPDRELWKRAEAASPETSLLRDLALAASEIKTVDGASPEFTRNLQQWDRRGSDMWVLGTDLRSDRDDPSHSLRLSINVDGRAHLFCGRAAHRFNQHGPHEDGPLYLFEQIVGGCVGGFLAALGLFYERAGYAGSLDVGVAVTGIEDAITVRAYREWRLSPTVYGAPTYTRTARLTSEEMADPRAAALTLVGDLIDATAGAGYELFAPAGSPR